MKKIILIAFVLGLTGCGKYPLWYQEQTADQAAAAAWINFSQNLLPEAKSGFMDALTMDSTHISANVGMGWVAVLTDSSNLENAARRFEIGMLNSNWKYDALCGLCVVKFILNEYPLTISLADLLLSARPQYVFMYDTKIDWHDILILKVQAQYFTGEYKRAWNSIQQLTADYTLNPEETETWIVNGEAYISFESALAKVIEELTKRYCS